MSPIETLKAEAVALQAKEKSLGHVLKHCDALEQVAKKHGYESWRACRAVLAAQTPEPVKGWLIMVGGGGVPDEVKKRFVSLAGGPNANFVLIPTAMSDDQLTASGFLQGQGKGLAKLWGINPDHITMLHARDKAHANSAHFIETLRKASGVWIPGGRHWRLVDAYLDTAVEREIKELVARGGVVAGSSAGATIQGSFLIRGDPGTEKNPDGDNTIMIAKGYERGFGLLSNSAIDQHVNTRRRENDLAGVIEKHPELLGIGIDEGTAIVVHGDSFEVIGSGRVTITDGNRNNGAPYYFLSPGQTFDLKRREAAECAVLAATEPTVASPPAEKIEVNFTEMKRYESSEWNFALEIPKRWNSFPPVPANSQFEVIRFRSLEDGNHLLIVFRMPHNPKKSHKEIFGNVKESLASKGFGNFVTNKTSIGSREAPMLDFDKPQGAGIWSCRHYFITEGTLGYILGFGTNNRAGMFELYDRMAKSFEILAEPPPPRAPGP
ncbi:MAG TPA: Type 1 glutamine amidotransferase-like domain-containing protein [Opitutaceae bacterium]|jgi:cyanophycinase|nr:Type 1 glutamine amidotransferase-like domain-containing protein [Opitutaceae bacterium]